MSYVSLHTHTSKGSLLDGMGLTDDYCEYAAELGMTHLGISDHGTIDNYIEFQNSCKRFGVIPVFGVEFYIVPDIRESKKDEQRSHILAFAKNETGFQNICRMVTVSNLEGFYKKPRISPEVLLNHSEGLVITTGCSASPLFYEYGLKLFEELLIKNPGDVYLEVMPHTHKEQYEINEICKQLSHQYNVKMIATNDSHYVRKDDAKAHEVLLAVGTKKKWNDPARWSFNGSDFYLRGRRDMVQAFVAQGQFEREEINSLLLNTMEIAEKCSDFQWVKGKPLSLPAIKTKSTQSDYELLAVLCEEGFKRLVAPELDVVSYRERLEEELSLIKEKNFERYFLVVWDLIKWCQEEGIMTGPGRGSSSGSLVCYLLGITQIDPIKHGLLFFRFLSPDRIDLPDIDSDFSDVDRPRIRKRLEDLYGTNNIASVSTYSVLRGRGAIRDVSRVFDVPLKRVNEVCTVIEKKIGEDEGNEHTIENALLSFEDGQKFYEEYPEVSDIAIKLEGQYRNRGVHASALVIADEDLTKGTRCSLVLGKEKEHVIGWDKNIIEYFGLIKLDVLGLKMLTVLNYCRKLIKENHGIDIDYNNIPLEDEKYYSEFSKGNTVGCFQLGSVNMRKFCRQLGLDNFETLVAATALYRPGPLGGGATELYIKRKNGEEAVPFLHPILDEITKDTYGVIIYQEQLMLIMHLLAGMEWSVVDKVRKLVAKSKGAEALQKYEEQFVSGCKENKTISEEMAHNLWSDLLSFGAYGFNKCLTGDTVLYRSSGNQYEKREITIEQLYNNWYSGTSVGMKYRGPTGIQILQYQQKDGRIRPGKVKGIYKQGFQTVYEITTLSGKKIRATNNHRFLVPTANNDLNCLIYTHVYELNPGDRICLMGRYENTAYVPTGVARYRGHGKTYSGCGFKSGAENIAFFDGRAIKLKSLKKDLFRRSEKKCEKCGRELHKSSRPELAHIKTLVEVENDYSRYHSAANTLLLCNSCHKRFDYLKGERRKRHFKGRPVEVDIIVSIVECGQEMTYDIEMEGPDHNFVANDFISHNSHSCSYSHLTVWDIFLKLNYPAEFMTALLTYGTDNKDEQEEYIREAFRLGLDIRPPKVGISDAVVWTIHEGRLYAPFIEIVGVGDKTAISFQKLGRKKGFITEDKTPSQRFIDILEKIDAYNDIPLSDIEADRVSQFLGFSLVKNKLYKYKKLHKLLSEDIAFSEVRNINIKETDSNIRYYFGLITELNLSTRSGTNGKYTVANATFRDNTGDCKIGFDSEFYRSNVTKIEHCEDQLILIEASSPKRAGSLIVSRAWFQEDLLTCNLSGLELVLINKKRFQNYAIEDCHNCELYLNSGLPQVSKTGLYNVLIISETGIGLGYDIWRVLKRHGLRERDFNISSFLKCPLKSAKDITREHIEKCKPWLEQEIQALNSPLVLAIGNNAVKFFTPEDTGINALAGTTAWNEKYGCYVAFCTSPSSLYYGGTNIDMFEDSIKNFAENVKNLGLNDANKAYIE